MILFLVQLAAKMVQQWLFGESILKDFTSPLYRNQCVVVFLILLFLECSKSEFLLEAKAFPPESALLSWQI